MANVKVSVIIPVYNVEKYLAQCLDSVINQTLKDIEIICVDDGSPDNSGKILDEYAARDARIRVIHQKNAGQGVARNVAMQIAKGEYIQFLDSDDWLAPNACEILYTKAKKHNLDMLNFAGTNVDDATGVMTQWPGQTMSYAPSDREIFTAQEVQGMDVPISAARFLYRRAFLDDNNIRFPAGLFFEDNVFCHHSRLHLDMYGTESTILYFRRVHGGSVTQNWDKNFASYIGIIYVLDKMFDAHEMDKTYVAGIIEQYCLTAWKKYNSFSKEYKSKHKSALYALLDRMQGKYTFAKFDFHKIMMDEYKSWLKRAGVRRHCLAWPRTFNEKIQWLKLFEATPEKTRLTDKFLVRDWVSEKIGEKYLIPVLGVYDNADDIDFDALPDRFVIKCNHASAFNIIVQDKSTLDIPAVRRQLNDWLYQNFAYMAGLELQYRDIQPKLVIEEFVTNDGSALYDYKFWCFNGRVCFMQFRDDFSDNLKMVFYDMDWNKLPFYYNHPQYDKDLPKPDNFQEMIDIAQKLCAGFAMVCVDLYRLNNGDIKFGEMTFSRTTGAAKWNAEKYNRMLGKMIKLPDMAYDINTGQYYKYQFAGYGRRALMVANDILDRLVCVRRKADRKTVDLFGVRVWKTKYLNAGAKRKFYLCGLCVASVERKNGCRRHRVLFVRWWSYPSRRRLNAELTALRTRVNALERRLSGE